jgi:hypothetical protein
MNKPRPITIPRRCLRSFGRRSVIHGCHRGGGHEHLQGEGNRDMGIATFGADKNLSQLDIFERD